MKNLFSTTALILSLTVYAGAYANDEGGGKGGKHMMFKEALEKLPKQDAAKFRESIKKGHEKNKALFEQVRSLHKELHEIMIAESFDKAAFISKSNSVQKLEEKIHARWTENFANAFAQLSQADRKIFTDNMHEHKRGPHGKEPDGATLTDSPKQ